jgi:hypothetical protein
METPFRFWVTGFMNKWYNSCCSFFHYGHSIFHRKNAIVRLRQPDLRFCYNVVCASGAFFPWWLTYEKSGHKAHTYRQIKQYPDPKRRSPIAPEGFVLLPIVDPFINKWINYHKRMQLSWPDNWGWSQLTTGHWNCSSQQRPLQVPLRLLVRCSNLQIFQQLATTCKYS